MIQTMSANAPQATEDLMFEDAIDRLEGIVRKMEEEKVPLDELIRDYESGSQLLGICRSRIAMARERVEVISRSLSDGGAQLDKFEEGDDESAMGGDGPDRGGSANEDIELL